MAKENQGSRTDLNFCTKRDKSLNGELGKKVYSNETTLKPIHTDEELARLAGVGRATVCRYKTIKKEGSPEQQDILNETCYPRRYSNSLINIQFMNNKKCLYPRYTTIYEL